MVCVTFSIPSLWHVEMPLSIHLKSKLTPLQQHMYTHYITHIHIPLFILRGNNAPKYQFAPGAQSCGLIRVGKNLIIGLTNKTLVCYTPRVSDCLDHTLPKS